MTSPQVVSEARTTLGRFGVWLAPGPILRATPLAQEQRAVAQIEELGYGSVWIGEGVGGSREIFAHMAALLAATESIVIGSGVAVIGAREAAVMHAGAATLAEAYPGRVVLGVGAGAVAAIQRSTAMAGGSGGAQPTNRIGPLGTAGGPDSTVSLVDRTRDYLHAMSAAAQTDPGWAPGYVRVLAALGPKMLAAAREVADGAHPFSVPVEHTKQAREILGPGKLLIPEQAVVLDDSRDAAAATARAYLGRGQVAGSPYAANLRQLGFTDRDFADGGSDRLLDARFALGDERSVAERLHAHLRAGADSVLAHVVGHGLDHTVEVLRRLAPLLFARG
ncbi:LLM class flavin-dependent oxidoreductase [Nocardia sp. alder85J]|uniref:LLM class flavin-dependent oxidoreductase n=1 Tax=Nocardia sp. alder85J TaxID=2862949 RepID=UPI001CD6B7EB|nr:LLM class flavin-dependent oxidoreductase [Nocardia sp. alder85J]MCX4098190.1 LLM class flavin-dependent oxidoreductase [Nocardia sp. alder85J]